MVRLQKEGAFIKDWFEQHEKVISDFLLFLNEKSSDFVLKGDTALQLCYNLDRFSEDIDFDGKGPVLIEYVTEFCENNDYSFRIGKHTETVERYFINYGNDGKPLKIETSFRRREIPASDTTIINGILVYKINPLCAMKVHAYEARDTLRDLYDISFIYNNYHEQLTPQTIDFLRGAVEYKGIEQFDFVTKDQHDDLINSDKLTEDFLHMYFQLGLLVDEYEREILSKDDMVLDNPLPNRSQFEVI